MNITNRRYLSVAVILVCFLITGCKSDPKKVITVDPLKEEYTRRKVPKFDQESAYTYVAKQVDFGPRYPGSEAHRELIDYLVSELSQYTDKVIEQDFKVDFMDMSDVDATNIIAIINPDRQRRVLLAAHFDTRMIAEKDDDPSMVDKPILGADDGASGVGVLLEIAKKIKENGIDIGVDIVLFDAEDNGTNGSEDEWCLGAKYWAQNPHVENYKADFGILLDMVGAEGAEFGKEAYSMEYAGNYVNKIWNLASNMNASNYFKDINVGGVTDDHKFVIQYRNIPMLDIINMSPNHQKNFDDHHHTHDDNMDIIDKSTLRAVGKVVLATIYNYNNRTL